MAILKDILYKVPLTASSGDMGVEVKNVVFDSRQVVQGSLFVAVIGTQVDGHDYITQAVEKGACAVIAEEFKTYDLSATLVTVKDSAEALGIVSSNYYDNPSQKLKLVAVTGTNGKTSIVTMLHQLYTSLGYKCGMLSTIENKVGDEVFNASHTTGDAIQINKNLKKMVDQNCTFCFMEASSHAIHQQRIAGLYFAGAVFTNLSHDHLDYHKTFDHYLNSKKQLFDKLPADGFALVNRDDKRGIVMLQNTKAIKRFYAVKSLGDFSARILSHTFDGLELIIDGHNAWFGLVGEFNVYNILAVYGAAVLLGEDPHDVLIQLSAIKSPAGRFERVINEQGIICIVDYAHTPDALTNVLGAIAKIRTRNETLITVVGCGGNRDKEKRPKMASIACSLSDKVIVTSDNPRDESPDAIIDQMMEGVTPVDYKKTLRITDRKEAIKTAVSLADKGDIILLAGKGHETYQEIKGVKSHFDDREIAAEMIELIHKQ